MSVADHPAATNFSIENKYSDEIIAGVDEVGRGAWAGPVVAGAVIIKQPALFNEIVDSKKTSLQKRKELSDEILREQHCGIGLATVEEVNSLGLNPALFLAMNRALASLPILPTLALVDGNYKLNLPIKSLSVIKGDQKSISIAAASIIAKIHRDNLMRGLARSLPHYRWETNVGYGTTQHIEMIKQHGVSEHHRKNFKPIKFLQT
jgi:ribonuclease HII